MTTDLGNSKALSCQVNDLSGFFHSLQEDLFYYGIETTTALPYECRNITNETDTQGNRSIPNIYGNVEYALEAYRTLVPVAFGLMLLMVVICFTVFFVQYKRVSPISNSVYAMLVSITLFNFLTIAGSFVEHSYLYEKKTDQNVLPFHSCETLYMLEKISQICHSVSVWLTAAMCAQKTICICLPFVAKRIISMKGTSALIVISILLGISPFIVQFVDSVFTPYTVVLDAETGETLVSCRRELAGFITDDLKYLTIMAWTTVLMTRLVPCLIILAMSTLIIVKLRQHNDVVRNMSENQNHELKKRAIQRTHVAMLVFFVAMVVFSVEVSTSIVYILFIVQVLKDVEIIDTDSTQKAAFGIDIVLYVSYVVILQSYCLTPRTLRNFRKRWSEWRSGSLPTEKTDFE